jgi:hypothetical protein
MHVKSAFMACLVIGTSDITLDIDTGRVDVKFVPTSNADVEYTKEKKNLKIKRRNIYIFFIKEAIITYT